MLPLVAAALFVATPAAPVAVELDVRVAGGGRSPALAWVSDGDGGQSAWAADPAFDARVRVGPEVGGSRPLSVEIAWRAPAAVERVAARVRWSGVPSAVDRTLRWRPVPAPIRVGRGTPVVVAAGGVLLAGGPGVTGARIEPLASPAAGGLPGAGAEVEVTLLADDADDRPFASYAACVERLDAKAQHGQFGALEHKVAHREAPRAAGDVDRLAAALIDVASDRAARPVVLERWPAGARAALVFTDHADRTDPEALAAILWGTSSAPGATGRGFLGRGLRLTRSFFVASAEGGLDDPTAAALADDLVGNGSEVALHSITERRDSPADVREGLAAAARWAPATWIDHQPYTNCEAFSAQGWRADGPSAIRDALAGGGIRWVWAAGDVAGFRRLEVANVLDIGRADDASPAIYPFAEDPRLWIFQSSMFFAPPEQLAEALSGLALERLEAGRGLFVGHTYFGGGARWTPPGRNRERLAVRPAPGGGLEISPALDEALARIEARVAAGALASLTWAEAGDRLRALADVEVAYQPDGTVVLRNGGAWPIEALTIGVPEEGLELVVDGAGAVGRADLPGWSRAWFDLPPGATVRLRATRGGADGAIIPLP